MEPPDRADGQPRRGADGDSFAVTSPAIALPKGGAAIRGIGEKFAASPATGTGSMSVPIACSPGRSGFGPQLALTYDAANGNGPFGFGWSLQSPSITRKTDKGLPQYLDGIDADVFIHAGSEDLVAAFREDPDGRWLETHPGHRRDRTTRLVHDGDGRLVVHEDEVDGYRVRRYRPRIEAEFSRIERWSRIGAPADVHWRSISRDNVLAVYGSTPESRIADPDDPRRIFSWLICETRDDRGNAILYRYKEDDAVGVDVCQAHERHRGPRSAARRRTNRYLKRIYYGNRTPLLESDGSRPRILDKADVERQIANAGWMFEIVFDYGDHDLEAPTPRDDAALDADGQLRYPWPARRDPFSSYRATFEIRTTRLCRRVLMFHHFPGTEAAGVGTDCLVRSTDLTYADQTDAANSTLPIYAFLTEVAQAGYRRRDRGYERQALPAIEFDYTKPAVQDAIEHVDAASLGDVPTGFGRSSYRWADLHGEGAPGILAEQAGAWFYKRNRSPLPEKQPDGSEVVRATFAPVEVVPRQPNVPLSEAELVDLTGDGVPDVVSWQTPVPGIYKHDAAEGWHPFKPFAAMPSRDLRDPNLTFIDLDGDGRADLLITEDDAFVWHASLGEDGFAPARRAAQALDEEYGARVLFADAGQSIHLADVNGDGLTDLLRIRNGDVCYWPNLGYGCFGAKVTMDNAPWLDEPNLFDRRRILLADIDGSGTADLIYLHRDGVRLYFNQSGNSWSQPTTLRVFPAVDDVGHVVATDLLGNGTACLVWTSPLASNAPQPMRYVNLMGGQKPHLLARTANNLGAETRIHYAPSTKFYLEDRAAGTPWVTRLPFPVHVVERIVLYDHVSRNRFVTRYAYHHGHYDGEEREFRGFGMVEQWDTEELGALRTSGLISTDTTNESAASHVAPVRTRTWFHTGAASDRDRAAGLFADEYFRERGLREAGARALLLPDTVIPPRLAWEEQREAFRALKGFMLRQETYADDAGPDADVQAIQRARTPYVVTEQSATLRRVQPRGANRHAVFYRHPAETVVYRYDRNPADPRVEHTLTLEVDRFGNVLKQASVAYGRRPHTGDSETGGTAPTPADRLKQSTTLATFQQSVVTNAVESIDTQRTPQVAEVVTFELTGYTATGIGGRFQASDLVGPDPAERGRVHHTFDTEVPYESPPDGGRCRRRIECLRTLFRRDDLSGVLPLGEQQSLGLPAERYRLAFTTGLMTKVFGARVGDLAAVMSGTGGNQGGYLEGRTLKADGRFPGTDRDDDWWGPSGRTFFTTAPADDGGTELAYARAHFFVGRRYRDPFDRDALIEFDADTLLATETRDALGNRVTVDVNDYRVLQPRAVTDPNGNQSEVAFDALGLVVGAAVKGKPGLPEGDTLEGFEATLTQTQIDAFFDAADPVALVPTLLQSATTRIVYDVDRFRRTQRAHPGDPAQWQPAWSATLARDTHAAAVPPPQGVQFQATFSYCDGFAREIQKKGQAEPGPVVDGGPAIAPRWIASAWRIFNNKGKPVREYEPFFSATHRFEFGVTVGVGRILFYDPADRVVVTLHPNHTYEKALFGPWARIAYDTNDTCAPRNQQTGDPRTDPDVRGFVAPYFASLSPAEAAGWQTWYEERSSGQLGAFEQAAAQRAAAHSDTPGTALFDAMGRPFLTISRNRVVCSGHPRDGSEEEHAVRVEVDIEGNQREVRDSLVEAGDPRGRLVMRYEYDMLGNRIHQDSVDGAASWMLVDATARVIRAWDRRGHEIDTVYDGLRRQVERWVRGAGADVDPRTAGRELLVEKIEYGEGLDGAETLNLRRRVFRHFDGAGVVWNARLDAGGTPIEAYDFKGNLLASTRCLLRDSTAIPDWQHPPALEEERFESRTRFDALNHPIQSIAAHSSLPRTARHVIQPRFNEAGLSDRVDVWLSRDADPEGLLDADREPPSNVGIANVEYDARGQRLRVDHKNGSSTRDRYDPNTFRLTHRETRRGDGGSADAVLQSLHYTHDPAGNITHVRDTAQQTVYFSNRRVDPDNDFVYDALYRLIQAAGREHLGQLGGGERDAPRPPRGLDAFPARLDHPNVLAAMGRYVERYVYDAAGNILEMQHRGSDPEHAGWTRHYEYAPGTPNNRLSATTLNADGELSQAERYEHDLHGNMTRLPHLGGGLPAPNLLWDYRDELCRAELGGGGTAHYTYDASGGQRVRKVWEKSPALAEERLYLGAFELFRRHHRSTGGNAVVLERETLHVMHDTQRVAAIELRTVDTAGDDPAPARQTRYQIGNHLGSAVIELDDEANVVSYEEYAPYGATTYQAVRSETETAKRYRYSGKEHDDETGLYYFGARYYAAWLGRWTSADPAGFVDGENLYVYVRNNPIVFKDPDGREIEAYNISPGRPGNQPFNWFLGVSAHRLIAYAYVGKHMMEKPGIYSNYFTVASILNNARIGDPARLSESEQNLKPDITNVSSREVFEIKPWNQEGLEAGRKQAQGYLDALNKGMGVPPGGRASKGHGRYPFLTGIDEQGQMAVQFHGGKMVWRLTWKTTEPGVIQYKWQKTSKTDRDEIRKAGEGQWVDITEADAQAYGQEVHETVDTILGHRAIIFKAMDATNTAQSFVGAMASAILMGVILGQLGRTASVPAKPVQPGAPPPPPPQPPVQAPPPVPRPVQPPQYIPPPPPPPPAMHPPM